MSGVVGSRSKSKGRIHIWKSNLGLQVDSGLLDFGLIIEIVSRFEYRGRGRIPDRISGLISKLESGPKSEVDVGFGKSNMRVRSLFELSGLERELGLDLKSCLRAGF